MFFPSATILALQFDIRQKLHLHSDDAGSLTGLAASAGHVEGEVSGCEVSGLGISK